MTRLAQRQQQEDTRRRNLIAVHQSLKEKNATIGPDGKQFKFVHNLAEMENRDHEAAKKIHDAKEADATAMEAFEKVQK